MRVSLQRHGSNQLDEKRTGVTCKIHGKLEVKFGIQPDWKTRRTLRNSSYISAKSQKNAKKILNRFEVIPNKKIRKIFFFKYVIIELSSSLGSSNVSLRSTFYQIIFSSSND